MKDFYNQSICLGIENYLRENGYDFCGNLVKCCLEYWEASARYAWDSVEWAASLWDLASVTMNCKGILNFVINNPDGVCLEEKVRQSCVSFLSEDNSKLFMKKMPLLLETQMTNLEIPVPKLPDEIEKMERMVTKYDVCPAKASRKMNIENVLEGLYVGVPAFFRRDWQFFGFPDAQPAFSAAEIVKVVQTLTKEQIQRVFNQCMAEFLPWLEQKSAREPKYFAYKKCWRYVLLVLAEVKICEESEYTQFINMLKYTGMPIPLMPSVAGLSDACNSQDVRLKNGKWFVKDPQNRTYQIVLEIRDEWYGLLKKYLRPYRRN